MNKVLEYIIRAKDATASGVSSAVKRFKEFGASVARNLANVQAGFQMLRGAANVLWEHLKKAFAFETMTVQFKTLIGNMDEARAHMAMLQKLGDTPPFSLEEFAKASRTLLVMTDGVLGFKNSLEMIGDAAAATGQNIESLSHHIGQAFASIRDGAPISRATFALRSMGVITPEVAEKLDEMQKSGATTTEMWETMETALKKYKGAMEETEQTGDGLIGAIQSQWDDAVRQFGASVLEISKDGLGSLLEAMKELNESGAIEEFAEKAVEKLGAVAEFAKGVGDVFGGLWTAIKGSVGTAWAFAAGMDEQFRNGKWYDIVGQIKHGASVAGEFWKHEVKGETDPAEESMAESHREELRKKRQQEKKAQAENEARKEAEEKEKVQKALEAGQRKIDEKRNAEAAKKAAEQARKDEEELQKRLEKEEQERIRMEQRISAERQKLLSKELAAKQKEEAEAQRGLTEAQANVRQAWGWYRDKDSLKAQLEEEKAEAAAQKQFEKDFAKLKDKRRDWRTSDRLTLDEEAVRRVGLAREAEAEAQKRLDEIAENTRDLAEKLDELLTMED